MHTYVHARLHTHINIHTLPQAASLQFYFRGVYEGVLGTCMGELNHGVAIVSHLCVCVCVCVCFGVTIMSHESTHVFIYVCVRVFVNGIMSCCCESYMRVCMHIVGILNHDCMCGMNTVSQRFMRHACESIYITRTHMRMNAPEAPNVNMSN
jgi:hypothetical protein